MAKKKTDGVNDKVEGSAPARKAPARRRAAPGAGSAQAAAARADDRSSTPLSSDNGSAIVVSLASESTNGDSVYGPSYQEIAEVAYRRYLSRGGYHGEDFQDWIEAERELRSRNA